MKPSNRFLVLNNEYYRLDHKVHKLINGMNDLTAPVTSQEVAAVVAELNGVRQSMVIRLKRATEMLMRKLGMAKHVGKWKFLPQAGDVCDGRKFWITHMLVDGKKRDLGSLSPTPRGDLGVFKAVFHDNVVMIPVEWLDDVTDVELEFRIEKFLLKRFKELKREANAYVDPPRALKAVVRTLDTVDLSK